MTELHVGLGALAVLVIAAVGAGCPASDGYDCFEESTDEWGVGEVGFYWGDLDGDGTWSDEECFKYCGNVPL